MFGATRLASSSAWVSVTPGLRRPRSLTIFPQSRALLRLSGTKRSTFAPGENTAPKSKLAGKTPTTVTGVPFNSMALPTMGGVGCELTPPIGITEQSDGLGNGATLIGGEEPPQGGLHAENLEEVADDFDAGGWFGLTSAGKADIIGGRESKVSSNVPKRAALRAEFFVGVRRVGRAGQTAVRWRRRDPHQLMRVGKGQRAQEQRVDCAEDGNVGSDGKSQDEDR